MKSNDITTTHILQIEQSLLLHTEGGLFLDPPCTVFFVAIALNFAGNPPGAHFHQPGPAGVETPRVEWGLNFTIEMGQGQW